ncbi:MAG: glycosyltransferase [Acidimicrobiia bacterium]
MILYVLKRYPRLSETFIIRELLNLEAAGLTIGVDALLEPEEQPRHPELDAVRAEVRYLPRRPRRQPEVLAAHGRVARRHPAGWARAVVGAARRHRQGDAKAWRRLGHAVLVADRIDRQQVTHVHAHFATGAAEVARDAAAIAGCPFSVTAHAKDIFHADNAPELARRLHGAAGVVTVSRYNVAHLRTVLDAPVHYVPNGMEAPPAHGPDPDGPLLCVARLVPKKGIDTLLRALAVPGSTARLELVGDGPLRGELEALVAELGLVGRVRLLGSLPSDEVAERYRRCSMFVLACRVAADGDRDGMPTVLVEAMGRGVPVISTDVAGIAELVQHGRTGLLVPPDDPEALAAAIDKLAHDPALAADLGAAGRELVVHEFDPARAATLLREVFACG